MSDFSRPLRALAVGLPLIAGFAVASPAIAQSPIKLVSGVEVEKTVTDANGNRSVRYEVPEVVVPGDRLRFTLRITNTGAAPAANVVINNPIPAEVAFESTPDLANFSVSVDGGKSFGDLAALQVASADGTTRPAAAGDVTSIRWIVAQLVAPQASHSLTFFGRVR